MSETEAFDPAARPLSTPIAEYGIEDVSRPVAARLLGRSLPALARAIAAGRIQASGKVHARVAISELERVAERSISCHQYLSANQQPKHRRGVPARTQSTRTNGRNPTTRR